MNIFLVDDSEADALLITDILSTSSHSIVRFRNGELFTESLSETVQADLLDTILILDLVMPKKDGYEIVRELGARGLKIPTILVTAKEDEYLKIFRRLAEAHHIPIIADMRKPVDRIRLLDVIRDYELNQTQS